ncbi:MAG: tRNA 2-thiocytidine(32) synthetase TtcA [Parasporobacterium sp.]|nr:tRNA 2-thiocytidine(32) synthetase TtcA [Parasporobacterium sp.]
MNIQQLLSLTRQAVDDYKMISDGDHIAVGVSGGKDSLTLLSVLNSLRRFYPAHFDITAITADLGFNNVDFGRIADFCSHLGIEYHIEKTEISEIVFNIRKEKNPCSLCSKLRKGAFNNAALKYGCNKTAFGHHKDDVISTMMMSLIYEGRFSSFSPVTVLERTGLTLIRPMIYINEADIKGFCNKNNIPVLKNPCPADGETRRQYVKEVMSELNHDNHGVKERLFNAVLTGIDSYKTKNDF